jgi:hypothetical protein
MKTYEGMEVQSHALLTSLSLYPGGKSRRYPVDRRLGEPQNRSGSCEKETKLLPVPEIGTRLPVVWSLYRLSFPGLLSRWCEMTASDSTGGAAMFARPDSDEAKSNLRVRLILLCETYHD